jgi:hypothetical protein
MNQQHDAGAALHEWLLFSRGRANERTREALRCHVWDYVDDRKNAGWTVDRIITAAKQIAREAGLMPSNRVTTNAKIGSMDQLLADMVGWCIHRYHQRD